MSKEYGNNSIRRQDDREACRKRLPTYFGTTELAGAVQSIKEILSNAIDEEKVKDKKGKVKLTIHKDNSITVEDEGRGLPLDWNKNENCYNAELMLSTLHAGGKFDDNRGDNFVDSAGMNGLGLTVTALSSKWIKVESRRDGYIYNIEMKEGYYSKDNDVAKSLKKEKDPKGKNQKTGTKISWKCDTDEVYLDDNFDLEEIKSWVDMQARLADGVVIELKDERVDFKQDYCYKDGLRTFMESQVDDPKSIVEFEFKGTGKDSPKQKNPYEVRGRVLFAFTDGKKTDSMWYHNSLPMTLGGSPKNAEQNAFINFFSKRCKGVKKLEFSDIQENLIFYSNTLTQIAPAFKNQTKDALGMPFIEQCLQGNIEKNLEKWAKDNPLELDKMTQQIEANNQARLTSASVKQLTKEKLSGKIKLSDKILKLTECDSDDVNITEVYFCLKGDTKIKLLDGTNPTIESLVGKKDLWAYSTNKNGAMIPAKIKEVFETQKVDKLVKITFNDGSVIECTPEHKFLNREDCSWVQAKDLTIGQSLFSMKFGVSHLGHTTVYIPGNDGEDYIAYNNKDTKGKYYKGVYEDVHKRVALYLGIADKFDGETFMDIHHKDLNKQNNDPSNLQYLTKKEHLAIHNKINYENGTMDYENKHFTKESRERMQTAVYRRSEEGINKQRNAVSQAWRDGKYKNATWADTFNKNRKLPDGKDITYKNKLLKFAKKCIDKTGDLTRDTYEAERSLTNKRVCYAKYETALTYFGTLENFKEEAKNYNLEIINIETVTYNKKIPVYCLNIDNNFHSFVLENGIITHNCEGDSASSIKDARDAKFQAIYAMRGKPKNVMKMNLGKILEHQVLMDILKVIGTGVQLGGKKNQIGDYDFTKRKFGKYIIASDADSDGDHIACLMLTIFYTLMPELLEKGCVYRLLTPLFVNELKDGTIKEAYTDKDQDEILKKFGDKIKKTSRYKGLGEWNSEDIEPYVDPNKNRKLVQYTIEDAKKAKEIMEMWMAGDAEVRRTFINEHGDEYKDLDFSGGSD